MKYAFGDSEVAARRLGVLAEVFAESSQAFLASVVVDKPPLALDLGCGPGHTTHMLAEVLGCERVVGLDSSEHFLSLAKRTETARVSFAHHDVTSLPFPVGPSDLLYCRYLLTHLEEPLEVVRRWASQLRPRGLLLMEEVEWIHTDNALFARYLEIVDAMLAHQGNTLYVGPLLDGLKDSDALRRRASRVGRLKVSNARAATMFVPNIHSWKERPFVQANYSSAEIHDLEQGLRAASEESCGRSEIEWGLRQIVFEECGLRNAE